MTMPTAKKCSIGCFAVALISGVIAVAAVVALPIIIHDQVLKTVVLKKGTPTYPEFLEPSIPVYMQIYVFDLINKAEVLEGAKPYVVERGPYTYREHRIKFDLIWDNKGGLVTYKQNRTFFFEREMSVGPDTDTFTTANIPLMTLMRALKNQTKLVNELVSFILNAFPNETLFINRSVREVTWGYFDPILAQAHAVVPHFIPTDFVGVFTGMNASYDGVYKVVTGVKDPVHLGQILTFNGSITVPYWSTHYANLVNGSDGTLAPPFLNKSSILPIFVSDICRSVYGLYKDTRKTRQGIPVYRFTAPPIEMANATINPDNIGFCVPDCLPSGLVDLHTCKMVDGLHLPVVASYPHFLDGDPSLVEAVGGLRPDPEWHRTYTNLEPTSGIVMEIYKRLQINVKMSPVPGFERLQGKVRSLFYPVLWLNESAVVDDKIANLVKSKLLIPVEFANIGIYLLSGLAGFCALLSLVFFLRWFPARGSGPAYVAVEEDNNVQDEEVAGTQG